MSTRLVLVAVLTLVGAGLVVGGGARLHQQYRNDRALLASPYP